MTMDRTANTARDQRLTLPPHVDLDKETVITGRVVDDSGHTVGGASVRLLDSTDEFTAELFATATGDFRFFAAPGTWTVRVLSASGNGNATVAPAGAGIHRIDIKVAYRRDRDKLHPWCSSLRFCWSWRSSSSRGSRSTRCTD